MTKWTKAIPAGFLCSWLAACGGTDTTPAETFAIMFGDSLCGAVGKCVPTATCPAAITACSGTAEGIMRCKVAEKDIIGVDADAVSKGTETFNQASADQCIKQIGALACATINAIATQGAAQSEADVEAMAPACNMVFAKK